MDLLVLAQRQCPQSFSVQASPSECLSKEKTRNLTPAKGQDKTWLLEQSLDIRTNFKLGEAFSKGAKFFGVLLVIDKSSHLAAHSFWIGFRDFGPCHTPWGCTLQNKMRPARKAAIATHQAATIAVQRFQCSRPPDRKASTLPVFGTKRAIIHSDSPRIYQFFAHQGIGPKTRAGWVLEAQRDVMPSCHANHPNGKLQKNIMQINLLFPRWCQIRPPHGILPRAQPVSCNRSTAVSLTGKANVDPVRLYQQGPSHSLTGCGRKVMAVSMSNINFVHQPTTLSQGLGKMPRTSKQLHRHTNVTPASRRERRLLAVQSDRRDRGTRQLPEVASFHRFARTGESCGTATLLSRMHSKWRSQRCAGSRSSSGRSLRRLIARLDSSCWRADLSRAQRPIL